MTTRTTVITILCGFVALFACETEKPAAASGPRGPETTCVWPGVKTSDSTTQAYASSPSVACGSAHVCVVCFNKNRNAVCYTFDPGRCGQ